MSTRLTQLAPDHVPSDRRGVQRRPAQPACEPPNVGPERTFAADGANLRVQLPRIAMEKPTSLVKFENPVLVGGKPKKPKGNLTQIGAIIDRILPPRQFEKDGQLWMQHVSPTPATAIDAVNLQPKLDKRLVELEAHETGICPVREELYAQVIDELVRQATVVCVERGLLLLRVRDEMRMTVAAYQKNYESLVAFSMRKTLRAEQAQDQLRPTIKRLEAEKKKLQKDVAEVRATTKCSFVLPCSCPCPCPALPAPPF